VLEVPRVDLALQRIAPIEQRPVARREIADQRAKAPPECSLRDTSSGNRLGVHEVVQRARNLHAAGAHQIHQGQLLEVRRQ
jgi:hypothetical protein